MKRINLNKGWWLREAPLTGARTWPAMYRDNNGWYKDLELPCDVHMPLIEAGVIKIMFFPTTALKQSGLKTAHGGLRG